MTQAKTKRAKETRTDNKARTEPPWNVILHNSWHPMSWVVYVLVKTIPGTTIKKATKVMWEAHTKGKAVAKTCHKELAELYEEPTEFPVLSGGACHSEHGELSSIGN